MSTRRTQKQQRNVGWTPPSESARRGALGKIHRPAALVAATTSCSGAGGDACCNHSGCFLPKTPATGIDWLADGSPGQFERGGQSFGSFKRLKTRRFPSQKKRAILLCNLDDNDGDETRKAVMKVFCQFMELYFGMPCEIAEPLSDLERRKMVWRYDVLPQLQTGPIQTILSKRLNTYDKVNFNNNGQNNTSAPFCIVGVTLVDLYPGRDWNFVFGEAVPKKGVGLFSFARFTKTWQAAYEARFEGAEFSEDGSPLLTWRDLVQDPLALRRALQTLAHETCHLFHFEHCVYYQCIMNGANHLEESDSAPMHLCPVCLRKLHSVAAKTQTPLDIVGRYQALSGFLHQTLGMTGKQQQPQPLGDDGIWYCQAANRCESFLSKNDAGDPMETDSD